MEVLRGKFLKYKNRRSGDSPKALSTPITCDGAVTKLLILKVPAVAFKYSVADLKIFDISFELIPLAVSCLVTPISSGIFVFGSFFKYSSGFSVMKPGKPR